MTRNQSSRHPMSPVAFVIALLIGGGLVATTLAPEFDLRASALFVRTGNGFCFAQQPLLLVLHDIASRGSWVLGGLLALGMVVATLRRASLLTLNGKGWLFLLLALLIGPGLIANIGLKDHWGRARPSQVTQFGGSDTFSPALLPQPVHHANGSFIAGDAAFGFFLPSLAYVVPRRSSRRFFYGGLAAGGIFALTRLMMGAHFISDILWAFVLMLACSAALHALLYGKKLTGSYWREWLS